MVSGNHLGRQALTAVKKAAPADAAFCELRLRRLLFSAAADRALKKA